MTDSRDTHSGDSGDSPCAPCRDPVMSWRRDGWGRPAHLLCQIRVRRRAEADRWSTTTPWRRPPASCGWSSTPIERGDLDASAAVRARLEGAATALEALTAGNP